MPAVRGKGDAPDVAFMAAQGVPRGIIVLGVPDQHRGITGAGSQHITIRAEGQAPDVAMMSAQGVQGRSGRHVPDADGGVRRGGSQPPAIGTEGHCAHRKAVAAEVDPHRIGISQVPQAYLAVIMGRRKIVAVGTEGDAPDIVIIIGQAMFQFAAGHVPDADSSIGRGGGQLAAVGAERQFPHRAFVSFQGTLKSFPVGTENADALFRRIGQEGAVRAEDDAVDIAGAVAQAVTELALCLAVRGHLRMQQTPQRYRQPLIIADILIERPERIKPGLVEIFEGFGRLLIIPILLAVGEGDAGFLLEDAGKVEVGAFLLGYC